MYNLEVMFNPSETTAIISRPSVEYEMAILSPDHQYPKIHSFDPHALLAELRQQMPDLQTVNDFAIYSSLRNLHWSKLRLVTEGDTVTGLAISQIWDPAYLQRHALLSISSFQYHLLEEVDYGDPDINDPYNYYASILGVTVSHINLTDLTRQFIFGQNGLTPTDTDLQASTSLVYDYLHDNPDLEIFAHTDIDPYGDILLGFSLDPTSLNNLQELIDDLSYTPPAVRSKIVTPHLPAQIELGEYVCSLVPERSNFSLQ